MVGAPKGRMEGAERGPLPRKHNDDPHGPRHPAFISVADCRSAGGYRPLPRPAALLPYKDRETLGSLTFKRREGKG